jgi:hypothetical protein
MSETRKIKQREDELEKLIALLQKLSVKVKYDRGSFLGGLFRYHDRQCFYLNRRHTVDEKIGIILNELRQTSIPEEILDDELRELLKEKIASAPAVESVSGLLV